MPRKLQFAFLGCHCSYLASVTYVNQSNSPHKAPDVRVHGLPTNFVENCIKFSKNRYVSNIRGHDCFAFLGHWTNDVEGSTDRSARLLAEMDSLREKLVRDKEENNSTYKEEDLLLSLGPTPSSYFADVRRSNRYRWNKLPETLEDFLQRGHPHGTIFDIAINSDNGWVIQLDKGRFYEWGGPLPVKLQLALEEGRERKAAIRNLYLNHQNSTDYVLLFTDAFAHMFPKPKKVKWRFIPSCNCDENDQHRINAEYYNQRGRFLLRRFDDNQALVYMREAYRLDTMNHHFRDDYYMARVAAGSLDPAEEDKLLIDLKHALQNEHAFQTDVTTMSLVHLKKRKQDILSLTEQSGLSSEWWYEKPPPVTAINPEPWEVDDGIPRHELPGDPHSEEMSKYRKNLKPTWG